MLFVLLKKFIIKSFTKTKDIITTKIGVPCQTNAIAPTEF